MLEVQNSLEDEKWKDNPDVKLNMISYLGYPLRWPDGAFFRTICSLDSKTRKFTSDNKKLMETFRKIIENDLLREYQYNSIEKDINEIEAKLVESVKMATLGELVAEVTHEVNTPIGIGITSASLIKDKSRNLIKAVESGHMTKSEFKDYIDMNIESAEIIEKNLEHAAKQIKSFKIVAVDQSSENFRAFRVNEYINEILVSLQPKIKNTKHIVTVNCNDDIVANSYPGALYQIFSNLINNSLFHGFSNIESGEIQIDISKIDYNVKIVYSDSGCGIYFDSYFTTRRGDGGSGLGMNITYNLVTKVLQGDIKYIERVDSGACFEIIFPTKLQTEG